MRTFAAIVLVGLVSVVQADLPHYAFALSFNTVLQYCGDYFEVNSCDLNQYIADSFPNNPEVRRLVRCTLYFLRSWNDDTGVVKHEISNFFQPSPSDDCYENRTEVCLESVPARVDTADFDSLAYESFLCYYNGYGDLVEGRQYVPNKPREFGQILVATSDYLELSEDTFVEFCKGNFSDNGQFPTVLYVLMVRGGFYLVNSGVKLDRLYNQYGNPQLLAPETQQCVDKVLQDYCSDDNLTQNYQVYIQCLDSLVTIRKQLQDFAKTRVSDPTVCDCTSPQIQVYNVV